MEHIAAPDTERGIEGSSANCFVWKSGQYVDLASASLLLGLTFLPFICSESF